jgi:hypothetical protein
MNKRLLIALVVFIGIVIVAAVILLEIRLVSTNAIIAVFKQRTETAKGCVQPLLFKNGRAVTKRGIPVKIFNARLFDSRINSIDASACPKRFQLAWLDYAHAVNQEVERRKTASEDTASDLVDFGEAAIAGETGHPLLMLNRLMKPVERAEASRAAMKQTGYNLEDANYNLKRVAIEYGVVFVRKPIDN